MLQETPPRSVFAGVPGERGLAHAARPFLFVSDLHLSDAIPHTVAAFERFVRVTADSADSVFILGDLFEYWIGDDILEHDPFAARMAALLHTFSERGIALYVMHGNRDFLLGKRFMKAAGALLIPDPSVIVAFGNRIVLAHGDAQCTADRGYQWFRRALAQRMRASSETGRMRPASPRYDVTRKGVAALLRRSGARTIIHGHTHKPARHVEADGVRWVLPDWELDHGLRRGGYLRVDAEGIRALPLD